jgi:hypothetical protein
MVSQSSGNNDFEIITADPTNVKPPHYSGGDANASQSTGSRSMPARWVLWFVVPNCQPGFANTVAYPSHIDSGPLFRNPGNVLGLIQIPSARFLARMRLGLVGGTFVFHWVQVTNS